MQQRVFFSKVLGLIWGLFDQGRELAFVCEAKGFKGIERSEGLVCGYAGFHFLSKWDTSRPLSWSFAVF